MEGGPNGSGAAGAAGAAGGDAAFEGDDEEEGAGAGGARVEALFCKYDALALGRVAGGARARKMLAAESGAFLFVSR